MDKSSASSQPQKSSVGCRERVTPPTYRPEIMTPPSTQSMVAPNSSTSQLPETSDGRMYLRILRDVAERIKPTEKLSEVFTQLAAQLREEEAPLSSLPLKVSTKSVEPVVALVVQPLRQPTPEPTTPLADDPTKQIKDKVHGEEGDENTQKPVGKEPSKKESEVVNVEEMESDDEWETLSEKATRRSVRTQRGRDREERNMRVEAAILAATKKRSLG